MAYKIALSAGHGRYTFGKRCMKKLDPKETREWVLNSRIAEYVETLLLMYDGYALKRVDDPTGKKDVPNANRAKAANDWGADIYVAIHHNAGVKGGQGGGICVYIKSVPSWDECELQTEFYDSLIKETGLKGNRINPKCRGNFTEIYKSKAPAVLLELGFMDSSADVPIILTDEYANKCAVAIVEVLAQRGKLRWIGDDPKPAPIPAPVKIDYAEQRNDNLSGAYVVDSPDGVLNLRAGASTNKTIIEEMKNGQKVRCYGYHTGKWLYVAAESGSRGFCHSDYLKEV